MPVLTGLDVVGIQSYVFGSSRLRDVVGASWLVDWATTWTRDTKPGSQTTGALNEAGLREEQVLLAAGGNAVLRFQTVDEAKDFAAHYSRLVFDKAPGVELVLAHRKYEDGDLAKALRALQVDLARTKLERRPEIPLLGISVTASCGNTGLPAVCVDKRDPSGSRLLSRQAERTGHKSLREKSNSRWRTLLPGPVTEDPHDRAWVGDFGAFDFPVEMDDLGHSRGERSLLGVVHIDGNSIGERIRNWLNSHSEHRPAGAQANGDSLVEREYYQWSTELSRLGQAALSAALQRVCHELRWTKDSDGKRVPCVASPRQYSEELSGARRVLSFPLSAVTSSQHGDGAENDWWLPIRPILVGGDDLTFLCDGRIALDLAATALRAMEKSVPHLNADKELITACAGVAIVPHHAPFVRSYELAEGLCQSAKKMAREWKARPRPVHVSCIDWHIGLPKPGLSVSELREREYEVKRGAERPLQLTCRPYAITPPDDQELSWQWLDETLLDCVKLGLRASKAWNTRRNKVKELREVLRSGSNADAAVAQALQRWQVVAAGIGLPQPINEDGFLHRQRTPLLDALELLDLHLPLGAIANAPAPPTKETP
jgi:hypothetical protein